MRASPPDPQSILAAMGYPPPTAMEPVTGGMDTTIFRVTIDEVDFALRIFRPDHMETCRAEVRAMQLAGEGGVPVPAVHGHAVWNDHPALLLSWCSGRPLVTELVDHPERAEALGTAAGQSLAAIHQIVVPSEYRNDSWLTWAIPTDEPLRHRLQAVSSNERLLHLDFHPLNVMTDGETITAVLDWANARSGDPRADLARTISILRLDAGAVPPEHQPTIDAFERGILDGYRSVAGELADMPLFFAYAGRLMLRDLADRLDANSGQRERIEEWITRWTGLAAGREKVIHLR